MLGVDDLLRTKHAREEAEGNFLTYRQAVRKGA
jgi:hypothetical protein